MMSEIPARIAVMVMGYVVATVGFAVAGVFCCIAAYSYFCTVISPAQAALGAAGVALVLALVMLAVVRGAVGAWQRRNSGASSAPSENFLGGEIGKMLGQDAQAYITANPRVAVLLAVCGGVVVGLSPRLREMAKAYFRL